MNRIYKVIWSKVKHQYVVVSELAHSCTKSAGSRVGRSAAAVLAALVLTTGLCAAPVQAEDLTDPYALLNVQVEETNSTSSDTLVTLVQSPLVKSVAPLANEDEGQPGEGGSSTVTTPDGQHTIYNEEGFYAHNGQGTYNSLTKDGLFVGGTDNGEGLYVDNDGNIYTDGNAEIEGSFSAADGNATIAADGTTVIRAGGSQLVVKDGAAGITHGNAIMAVSSNKAEMQGGGSSVIADLNGVTLTERTGNTTVTVNQDGMTVGGDFAVTGNTNLKHTNVDGDLNVSGSTHVVGGLTAGNLQTEGPLHAGSAVIDGSATVGGKLTAGDVKTNTVDAHNVSVDNELTAGKATIDGKLTAGSAVIDGSATVGGKLTAGDVKTNTVDAHNVSVDNELTAGKATVEGTVRAGSFANTNGSFTVDDVGDVEANDMTAKGDVSGATFANLTNTFAVDADGKVKAADITSTGNVQATGDVKGATFSNTANTFNVNASGDVVSKGNVSAVDVTASGALTGTTIANANNSFKVDTSGNVSANNVTALNEVSGMTFANTTDTFTVNADGDITSGDVSATGNVTATGNVQGATFSNTGNTFSVNADGDVTAADVTASGALTGTTIANANNSFKVDTSGNVSANNVTALNEVSGMTFANTTDTFAVDADGNITGESIIVDGKTYISSSGLNANGSVISNVATGLANTDAVNVGQLNAVDDKVGALDDLAVKYTDTNKTAVDLGTATLTTTGAISGGSVTVDGVMMDNGKITGLKDGTVDSDAVNKSQLDAVQSQIKTYTAGKGVAIDGSNVVSVKNGDGIAFDSNGNVEVKAAQDGNIVVDTNGVSLSKKVSGLTSIGTETITASGAATVGSLTTTGAISGGSVTAGTGLFSTSVTIGNATNGLKLADGEITGLVTGKIDASTDAVNVEYLKKYVSENGTGKTYTAGNGIAIDEADNNKISIKNGHGIEFDSSGNATVKAAQDGNIVVDTNGVSLSKKVSGLTSIGTETITASGAATVGSLTTTGAISGGSVTAGTGLFSTSVTIGNATNGLKLADGEITGLVTGKIDASTDAVNVEYLKKYVSENGTGKTYTAGNGIAIDEADNNKISIKNGHGIEFDSSGNATVKAAQDGNLVVGANGVSLSKTVSGLTSIGTGALTATGDVTAASFKVDDKTYISSTGLNANNQRITNVKEGNLVSGSKDAVNAGQLYDVKQSIKTYVDGDGITIAGDDNKISVNTGKGLEIADDKVQIKVNGSNLTLDEPNGLGLSTTLTGLESIETGTLKATGAVTAGSFSTTNGSATIGNIIINANNGGKITGLIGGVVNENSTEAINGGQLWKVQQDIQGISDLAVTYRSKDKQAVDLSYNSGNGTTITNVAAGDISKATSMEAVNGGQLYATNQIVGDGDYSSNNFLIDSTAADGMDLTEAASALDKAIGTNRYTFGNILNTNADGKTYTSITDAVDTLNRSIGSLTMTSPAAYFSENSPLPSVTFGLNELSKAIGPLDFDGRNFISNDGNLSSALVQLDSQIGLSLESIGFRKDSTGHITTSIDWTGFNYAGKTVVDTLKNLDKNVYNLDHRVGVLENEHGISSNAISALSTFSTSNISTLSALSNMDMSAVNTLSSLSADDLAAISTLSEDGSVPAANSDPNSRPGRGPSSGSEDSSTHDGNTQVMDHNLAVTGNVSVGGTLDVTGKATFGSDVSVGGNLDVQGETNMHGTLNMNNNKITGVTAGDISADSTDAINGSQLYDTNQRVSANEQNIGILGSAVNKLGDRIERVGAGAAALAALHPLDFDPDNKLDFAAGFGNYRGASAVAVGAFYRPSENVMFSVGGAFGGGEDMVNAGVSFKVGAGSGSATTSRTAMAKSLKSMQEVVASQDAQLAQQREQIDKLTAMVELLMEQNGQAQPKDGDAQAAQPQQ